MRKGNLINGLFHQGSQTARKNAGSSPDEHLNRWSGNQFIHYHTVYTLSHSLYTQFIHTVYTHSLYTQFIHTVYTHSLYIIITQFIHYKQLYTL